MCYDDDINNIKKYYNCQKDICLKSELFGNELETHGGKVLMLFAEIFSFFVDAYEVEKTTNIILNYQNSNHFKHWFWRVKHNLGLMINNDPTFYDIGKWIGSGLFLKMSISILVSNNVYIDSALIDRIIGRQRRNIEKLLGEKQLIYNRDCSINLTDDGYYLLKERTLLDPKNQLFFQENIISSR